jgi:hypothetical protein
MVLGSYQQIIHRSEVNPTVNSDSNDENQSEYRTDESFPHRGRSRFGPSDYPIEDVPRRYWWNTQVASTTRDNRIQLYQGKGRLQTHGPRTHRLDRGSVEWLYISFSFQDT